MGMADIQCRARRWDERKLEVSSCEIATQPLIQLPEVMSSRGTVT